MQHKFVLDSCLYMVHQDQATIVYALMTMPSPLKIHAVKYLRHELGCGLSEAKRLCEYIAENFQQGKYGLIEHTINTNTVKYYGTSTV